MTEVKSGLGGAALKSEDSLRPKSRRAPAGLVAATAGFHMSMPPLQAEASANVAGGAAAI